MKALKILSLTSFFLVSSAFAADSSVLAKLIDGEVHVRVYGQVAKDINAHLTRAPRTKTGGANYGTSVVIGKNIKCVTSSGIAYIVTCKFKVDADGVVSASTSDFTADINGSSKIKIQNEVASVTVSGKAGMMILKAMKNITSHGTASTTKSSDDLSCSAVKDGNKGEGSCRFNLDAYGATSSKY